MSQRPLPPRQKRRTNARIAISPARRRIRSGPSSIPSWTSESANEPRLSPLIRNAVMKAWAIAGIAGLSAIVAAHGQTSTTVSGNTPKSEALVTGNLQVPEDYRSAYQLLGSWAVAAEEG